MPAKRQLQIDKMSAESDVAARILSDPDPLLPAPSYHKAK